MKHCVQLTADRGYSNFYPKFTKKACRVDSLCISHSTETISEFINLNLRLHVEEFPSYLKDTTDYLNKTPSSDFPENICWLKWTSIHCIPNSTPEGYWGMPRSLGDPKSSTEFKLLEYIRKCSTANTIYKLVASPWAPKWLPITLTSLWVNLNTSEFLRLICEYVCEQHLRYFSYGKF